MQTDVIQSSKTFIASAEESYAILTAKNAAGRNVTKVVAHKELTTKNDVIMFPCNIRLVHKEFYKHGLGCMQCGAGYKISHHRWAALRCVKIWSSTSLYAFLF